MFGGNLGAADSKPLKSRLVDERCSEVALWALEGAACRRRVDRLLRLALGGKLIHARSDVGGIRRRKLERRCDHDIARRVEHAVAIRPVGLLAGHFHDAPLGGHTRDAGAHLRELAVVGACVHDGGAPDGAGDAAGELVARKPRDARRLGDRGVCGTRAGNDSRTFHANRGEVVTNLDHHALDPFVGNEQVASASDDAPGLARLLAGAHDLGHLLNAARRHEHVGGSADLEGGMRRKGL